MRDVMCDLETMGNGSKAAIIAIGAVKFDPKLKQIGDKFYSRVDLQSCLNAGLEVSADTIMWWLQQSEAARAEFKGSMPTLDVALKGFTAWMDRFPADIGEHRVWGNGATFDNVILSNAYKAVGLPRPWTYKNDRCYRTLRCLYPDVPLPQMPPSFVAHRADHDAEYQAYHLMAIWPKLRAEP